MDVPWKPPITGLVKENPKPLDGIVMMKGGIPRKGLIAHWQNSDVSSQIIVVSTFLSTLALVGAF